MRLVGHVAIELRRSRTRRFAPDVNALSGGLTISAGVDGYLRLTYHVCDRRQPASNVDASTHRADMWDIACSVGRAERVAGHMPSAIGVRRRVGKQRHFSDWPALTKLRAWPV